MNHRRPIRGVFLMGLCAAVAGMTASCMVGPNYVRPAVEVPAAYKSAGTQPAGETGQRVIAAWWALYDDPVLTQPEEQAQQNNPDLKAAVYRVMQARALAAQTRSQLFPQITFSPTETTTLRPTGKPTTLTQIPFDLSYEIDLWGQIARSVEAANATTRASLYTVQVVQQTLQTEVAQNYMNLRYLEAQDAIFTENVQLVQEQLDLTRRKLAAGIVGQIDVAQAQTQLDSLRAQQADIHRQRADSEHALAILTGKPPAEFTLAATPAPMSVPIVPLELPAEILRHRPDVAAAEQNLIGANAQVGVAIANFYPSIRLSGAAGFQNVSMEHVLDWRSALAQFGPSISLPIFTGGRLDAALQQAQARYDELVETYRSTILTAFEDVEVSLTNVHQYADELEVQQRAVVSAREYRRLAQLEYDQGLYSYLQLLDADRTVLTNEITEAQLRSLRLVATVQLIKALGGGWDAEPATTQPMIAHAP